MRISASLSSSLGLLGAFLFKDILSLHPSPTFKRQNRRLKNAGTWWIIANDNGTRINVHAPVPDSLLEHEKGTGNNKEFNYDEDKDIVPVILTCLNNEHLIHNVTENLNNFTAISMNLELDVFTTQVINDPVIAMLRQLELKMLRKTSEVMCPSTITYAELPSSRRNRRHLQAFSGTVLSFKVVDLTSMKFAVESGCNSEQQNGTVCIHIASQLKARITPPLPSDVETFPVSNMIKNLIGSMMNSGEFDTKRALSDGVLSVRYSATAAKVNSGFADSETVGILEPKSEAALVPHGMNSLGYILVALTLFGIAYAFFTFLRKKSFEDSEEEVESVLNDLTRRSTVKRVNLEQDTGNLTSKRIYRGIDDRSLTVVTKTNHDSVELEPLELETEYQVPKSPATGGEKFHQTDWRVLLSLLSTSGDSFFGARTPENWTKKRFMGENYEEIELGNNRAQGDAHCPAASTSWKDMAYAIIEQRKVRKEKSADGENYEILPQALLPPPPPPPPPPSTAYTAQELLQLADLTHSATAKVLHRSGPFNSWSPGKSPSTPTEKHAFNSTKQLNSGKDLPKDFPEDKYAPLYGTSLRSSEWNPIKTLSNDSLHDKYTPASGIDLSPSEDTLLEPSAISLHQK